jgi:hypothetical protein
MARLRVCDQSSCNACIVHDSTLDHVYYHEHQFEIITQWNIYPAAALKPMDCLCVYYTQKVRQPSPSTRFLSLTWGGSLMYTSVASTGTQYSVSSAPNSAIISRQRSLYESAFSRDRD